MTIPKTIVIGTANAHKVVEIRDALRDVPVELLDLSAFGDVPDVVEDLDTFVGNASKKAAEIARAVGRWTMADDSGLVVDALGGAPGVYSARYAGGHGDYKANNEKLLREMSGVLDERRAARFVCVIALADSTGEIAFTVEGLFEGRIAQEEIGANGFGYDPIFYPRHESRTVAEMTLDEKNRISHRALALRAFREELLRM